MTPCAAIPYYFTVTDKKRTADLDWEDLRHPPPPTSRKSGGNAPYRPIVFQTVVIGRHVECGIMR
jgi:hypothetical protein